MICINDEKMEFRLKDILNSIVDNEESDFMENIDEYIPEDWKQEKIINYVMAIENQYYNQEIEEILLSTNSLYGDAIVLLHNYF